MTRRHPADPGGPSRRAVLGLAVLGLTAPVLAACGGSDGEVEVTSSVSGELTRAWSDLAHRALEQVEDLWGRGSVARPVRLVLPADPVGFTAATGVDAGRSDVPALVVDRGGQAQVVVHPRAWDRLTPQGRQAVLTHEVAHLAMQGDAGSGAGPVPGWLSEGLAEHTAHRDSDTPVVTVAGSALDGIRAGEVPQDWPDPLAGEGAKWGRYALSWLACRYLAQQWGEPALMEVYAEVAAGADVASALRSVLGSSEPEVLAGWGQWLRELVADEG